MNETELIAGQIESAYIDGGWSGVSPRDLLRGLTAAQAAAHPIPGAHSAWEIALHIGLYHDAVRRRLAGETANYQPDEDWPAPAAPTDANWKAALEQIDRDLAALVADVRRLDPARLSDTVPGQDSTVYYMLHGIAQHDLYHAGQIALLRKMPGIE